MQYLMLPLSLAILLFIAPNAEAEVRNISGASLYKTTVLTAKSQVLPEGVAVQIFDEKEALKTS